MSKQKGVGFEAAKYAKNGVTVQDVEEIKAAFDLFDSDLGGSVDTKELKAAMTSLGFESRNGAVFQMICDLDSDGNGNLDFNEWFALMTTKAADHSSRAHFSKIFSMYDAERTGGITIDDLRRVAQDLGENIPEDELQELIARADLDRDNIVSEEEFYNIMTRKIET